MERITIYTTPWCGDCIETKKFLEAKSIPFVEINIIGSPELQAKVKELNGGNASVPTIVFEDGSILTEPTNQALLEKLKSI